MTHNYNGQNGMGNHGGNMRTVGYNNGSNHNIYYQPGNSGMASHSQMGTFGPGGGGKAGVATAVSISRGSVTKGMTSPHHH